MRRTSWGWKGQTSALVWALVAAGTAACTPDVANDPPPEAMEFDTNAVPPRVPQPTALVVNTSGTRPHIDFSLANIILPQDCADATPPLSRAECEFDQYLETLDGFPTVTPAAAPATAPLAPETLTVGTNVVVLAAKTQSVVTDVTATFDTTSRSLIIRPNRSWTIGASYLVGVRGYSGGVRAVNGRQVVGSPTQFLLKQTEPPTAPLTCGAADPSHLNPACPALVLLRQTMEPGPAAQSLFQLEAIRQAYQPAWGLMEQVGRLPRAAAAVMWSFPVHSASVIELDPTVPALLPRPTAADEIRVAAQGTIDPATVIPFSRTQYGSVLLMDLTAAQMGDGPGGFPLITATVVGQEIVIKGAAPFIAGHQYGLFVTNKVHDAGGTPLVPSPVSVLLRLRAPLVQDGHSAISTISDANAAQLEVGRAQLSSLFDDPNFAQLTQITREQLIYTFAFPFPELP